MGPVAALWLALLLPAHAGPGSFPVDDLEGAFRECTWALHAEVHRLERTPVYWSGRLPAVQVVWYGILRWYKGPIPLTGDVQVRHLLVEGAPTADPRRPGLDPAVFDPGREVVLLLVEREGLLWELDPWRGARPADEATLGALEALSAAR